MKHLKSIFIKVVCFMLCISVSACGSVENTETEKENDDIKEKNVTTATTNLSKIDDAKWSYNSDDDVYYQIGISYCETPADSNYETLAIFVPGAYMNATGNGDGTYTCEINEKGTVNGYTAATAPIVMPINTPGYSAQSALTSYTSVSDYMQAGFV